MNDLNDTILEAFLAPKSWDPELPTKRRTREPLALQLSLDALDSQRTEAPLTSFDPAAGAKPPY